MVSAEAASVGAATVGCAAGCVLVAAPTSGTEAAVVGVEVAAGDAQLLSTNINNKKIEITRID
jgi:hypothetical protein